MKIEEMEQLEIGDKVKCTNSEGWQGAFKKNGTYTVTRVGLLTIDLDGCAAAYIFSDDFEKVVE